MNKKLLAVGFSLVLATPSIAATSLIPKFILKNHLQAKNLVQNRALKGDEYVDFSGRWVGSCDMYPGENIELTIELASDLSSINIDNTEFPIDAISTNSSHGHDIQEHGSIHIRWSPDGQALLFTHAIGLKEGNLSQGGLLNVVGSSQLSMNKGQLVQNQDLTIFIDGILADTAKVHCIYNKDNG